MPASVFARLQFPANACPMDFHFSAHNTVCCLKNNNPEMKANRIVGIFLVRKEDFFVAKPSATGQVD